MHSVTHKGAKMNLKTLRIEKKLTQKDAAEYLGVFGTSKENGKLYFYSNEQEDAHLISLEEAKKLRMAVLKKLT